MITDNQHKVVVSSYWFKFLMCSKQHWLWMPLGDSGTPVTWENLKRETSFRQAQQLGWEPVHVSFV